MKKSRFTEEQIAFALKQAETGKPLAETPAFRTGAVDQQRQPIAVIEGIGFILGFGLFDFDVSQQHRCIEKRSNLSYTHSCRASIGFRWMG